MRSVLVVDDEAHIRRLISMQLERNGYEVTAATNGAKALECLRTKNYDAVVTDLSMPVMDGRELCTQIREEIGATVPVIVLLTSQVIDDNRAWVDDLQNAEALQKPISFRRLLRCLQEQLDALESAG